MPIVLAIVALSGATSPELHDEPEVTPPAERRTLVEPEANTLWSRPGFRADLGYAFVPLWGLGGLEDHLLHTPAVRLGFALNEDWLIAARAAYGIGSGIMRWTVTLEPMWQPVAGLRAGLGVGYAGITRSAATWGLSTDALFTEDNTDPLPETQSCDGQGVVFGGSVEYTWVLHRLFATGPSVRGEVQWTGCKSRSARFNAETGTHGSTRYNWTHVGVSLGWWLSWR